jgi:hypothetical protein
VSYRKVLSQKLVRPAVACCSADEKKYGKGCNSKFYAFSGFMNPHLSALLLPTRRSIPISRIIPEA